MTVVVSPTTATAANPYPVMLKVKNVAGLQNKYDHSITECNIQGAAIPELATERVLIRAEKLSCYDMDGTNKLVAEMKAVLIDKDHVAGIKSELIQSKSKIPLLSIKKNKKTKLILLSNINT